MREIQGPSTPEERTGNAGRVEIHACEDQSGCGGLERFPRFKFVSESLQQGFPLPGS